MSANPFQVAARARKASFLAAAARPQMSAGDAARATPYQRALVAAIARVRTPSDETWGLVVELLAQSEALIPPCPLDLCSGSGSYFDRVDRRTHACACVTDAEGVDLDADLRGDAARFDEGA